MDLTKPLQGSKFEQICAQLLIQNSFENNQTVKAKKTIKRSERE